MKPTWRQNTTARVKSLSFHPSKSWLAAGLYSGIIEIYDYKARAIVLVFRHDTSSSTTPETGTSSDDAEETGLKQPLLPVTNEVVADNDSVGVAVRGVDFHPTKKNLLVSGGDDMKLKIWNCDEDSQRCEVTIHDAHTDYIRSVQCHRTLPWILSSSDDQTIRIFDFVQRICVATLSSGVDHHTHYVMSASFHPDVDALILSASLDRTVQVWDVSKLYNVWVNNDQEDLAKKVLLPEHHSAVNAACFHPTLPLVASASDEPSVRLFRPSTTTTTDNEAGLSINSFMKTPTWDGVLLQGHTHNVTACQFIVYQERDCVVSGSEDGTLLVWDVSSKQCIANFSEEKSNNRFWTIETNPRASLFAAGSNTGILLFENEKAVEDGSCAVSPEDQDYNPNLPPRNSARGFSLSCGPATKNYYRNALIRNVCLTFFLIQIDGTGRLGWSDPWVFLSSFLKRGWLVWFFILRAVIMVYQGCVGMSQSSRVFFYLLIDFLLLAVALKTVFVGSKGSIYFVWFLVRTAIGGYDIVQGLREPDVRFLELFCAVGILGMFLSSFWLSLGLFGFFGICICYFVTVNFDKIRQELDLEDSTGPKFELHQM